MKFLTLKEVADAVKVSESTVRRWTRSGSLKAYKIGLRGQLRIKEEDLKNFIEEQLVQVENPDNSRSKSVTINKDRDQEARRK